MIARVNSLNGRQITIVAVTAILLSAAILPWGAAREWHVILSFVILSFVTFFSALKFTRMPWVTVGMSTAITASVVFIVGEALNRGENYWIFGLLLYAPAAILLALASAGIGRALKG